MKTQLASEKEKHPYPHSRKRVIVNAIVAIVSAIFAVSLLSNSVGLIVSYFAIAAVATALIFFIKEYLGKRISNSESREDGKGEARGASMKTILITFIGFLLALTLPLLSAGLVAAGLISADLWFIMVVGVTTGLGASEVVIYLRSKF